MRSPMEIYQRKLNKYMQISKQFKKSMNIVSNLRLLSATCAIINIIFVIRARGNWISLIVTLLSVTIFIYLVKKYNKFKNIYKKISLLIDINGNSMKRLQGEWTKFQDIGEEFQNKEHNYSYDLDIFGHSSLFQWINSANTSNGRIKLANILAEPCSSEQEIKKRQQTIKELSGKLWWRQKLILRSMDIEDSKAKQEKLIKWANTKNEIYNKSIIIMLIRILPFITATTIILAYGFKYISTYIPIILMILQSIILSIRSKNRSRELDSVYSYKNSIRIYEELLSHFQKGNFRTEHLNNLQYRLTDGIGTTAIMQIKELEALTDSILNRQNLLFFPINILTLWDYQCMIGLERWKRKYGSFVQEWLDIIGEVEALSSLASIGYDHPDWAVPIVTSKTSMLDAKSISHPLLTKYHVSNDVKFEDSSRVLLITGSNMSGKSTLLRTIGINLVLAYTGAPVSAKYLRCSIMNLYTCMRISDNLEKGISSFYGELLRIEKIVKATKGTGQVFFLLDEIFKGTNSQDRHLGAKVLITQLYNNGAMGLVSTHDLELGTLEDESYGSIKNFHFQESYTDNKIHFDYKLRAGLSTTRNALYLIKMAGVEIDESQLLNL